MLDLAEVVTKAVEQGGVTGVTLYKTASGQWQAATQRKAIDFGWSVVIHKDPILALMAAMSPEGRALSKVNAALRRAVAARS